MFVKHLQEYLDQFTDGKRGNAISNAKIYMEVNGHLEGKISADNVIIGKTAVIKGDIFFKNTLKTEEGADIDGYIKRANNGKSNTEEDIAIEEIVERQEVIKKNKPIHVVQQKKAV